MHYKAVVFFSLFLLLENESIIADIVDIVAFAIVAVSATAAFVAVGVITLFFINILRY